MVRNDSRHQSERRPGFRCNGCCEWCRHSLPGGNRPGCDTTWRCEHFNSSLPQCNRQRHEWLEVTFVCATSKRVNTGNFASSCPWRHRHHQSGFDAISVAQGQAHHLPRAFGLPYRAAKHESLLRQRATLGGAATVQTFARYFQIPGMRHCSGVGSVNGVARVSPAANPPLPASQQLYSNLTAWVESGT
jgi:hypothetical protein